MPVGAFQVFRKGSRRWRRQEDRDFLEGFR
jgi:hypothetical protein